MANNQSTDVKFCEKHFKEFIFVMYKNESIPASQLEDLRKAFYSGMAVMFGAMKTVAYDESEDNMEASVKLLEEIHKELEMFGRGL